MVRLLSETLGLFLVLLSRYTYLDSKCCDELFLSTSCKTKSTSDYPVIWYLTNWLINWSFWSFLYLQKKEPVFFVVFLSRRTSVFWRATVKRTSVRIKWVTLNFKFSLTRVKNFSPIKVQPPYLAMLSFAWKTKRY